MNMLPTDSNAGGDWEKGSSRDGGGADEKNNWGSMDWSTAKKGNWSGKERNGWYASEKRPVHAEKSWRGYANDHKWRRYNNDKCAASHWDAGGWS